jgi:TonB family protein
VDDERVTIRVPRPAIAFLVALVVHAIFAFVASRLPVVKPVEKPIEVTLNSVTPPPKSSSPSAPQAKPKPKPAQSPRVAPKEQKVAEAAPAPTTPVVPEIEPDDDKNRAELPVAEPSPEPPKPQTWADKLKAQLASTRPRPAPMLSGALAPSFAALDRVAANDPRMHDDENERRIMEDFGSFFRRGLEALRSNWHPDEVLDETERDPHRRCGHSDRMTQAVAVLDKSGHVVDVELKKESGCPDLDAEAVRAFKRVAMFPHPPAGLFKAPDGTPTETTRYPVRFIVTFDGGIRLDWRG